jgi:hypothetical protein
VFQCYFINTILRQNFLKYCHEQTKPIPKLDHESNPNKGKLGKGDQYSKKYIYLRSEEKRGDEKDGDPSK